MKKLVIILLLVPGFAFAVPDSTATKPPVRYFYKSGRPIAPVWVPIVYDKDCDSNGWKYNDYEWVRVRNRGATYELMTPRYYKDEKRGSNGGWEIG